MEHWWNETDQGKPEESEKPCPTASLSTTNNTWPGVQSNLGLHGVCPTTNSVSQGVAYV